MPLAVKGDRYQSFTLYPFTAFSLSSLSVLLPAIRRCGIVFYCLLCYKITNPAQIGRKKFKKEGGLALKDLFPIGTVAELFGVNVKTLRFYQEAGVLPPEYIDPKTGYRYYSTKQFERLNTIKYLRAMDIPLKQIKEFFDHRDVDTMLEILKSQREDIKEKIRKLDMIDKKISHRIEQIEKAVTLPASVPQIVSLPERRAVYLKGEITVEDDLEHPIRRLSSSYDLHDAIFLGKVGLTVSRENLEKRRFGNFSSVFVILDKEEDCVSASQRIDGGDYGVIRFNGSHREAPVYYCRLLDFLKEESMKLCGESIEITYIDYGMTNDASRFVTEIQIPVKAED